MKILMLSALLFIGLPDDKDKKKSKKKSPKQTEAGCVFLDGPGPQGITVNDTIGYNKYNFNFCGNEDIFKKIKVRPSDEN